MTNLLALWQLFSFVVWGRMKFEHEVSKGKDTRQRALFVAKNRAVIETSEIF